MWGRGVRAASGCRVCALLSGGNQEGRRRPVGGGERREAMGGEGGTMVRRDATADGGIGKRIRFCLCVDKDVSYVDNNGVQFSLTSTSGIEIS